MPVHSIEMKLNRPRNVYQQGEHISGRLVLDNKQELRHEGVLVSFVGLADLEPNSSKRAPNLSLESLLNGTNSRTFKLTEFTYELLGPGKLQPGRSVVPFRILIDGSVDWPTLFETYHGVRLSIKYFLRCRIKRSMFFRDLVESREIVLEYDPNPIGAPPKPQRPLEFEISPETLSAALSPRSRVPEFKICGKLDSLTWRLDEPITGEFRIEHCQVPIRSVELQLVRVETIPNFAPGVSPSPPTGGGNGLARDPSKSEFLRDASEVQTIQIGDGNLMRRVPMCIHMILPRLFTCATLITSALRIEFELNLVVIFADNHLVSENFPLKLIRSTLQPINNLS